MGNCVSPDRNAPLVRASFLTAQTVAFRKKPFTEAADMVGLAL